MQFKFTKRKIVFVATAVICALLFALAWILYNNYGEQEEFKGLTAARFLELGFEKHKRGQLKAAEADYQEALKLAPLSSIAYINLGDIKFRTGEIQQALDMNNKGLSQEPKNIFGLVNRSQCQLRLNKYAEAIEDASDAILQSRIYPKPELRDAIKTAYLVNATAEKRLGQTKVAEGDLGSARDLMHEKHAIESDCADRAADMNIRIKRPRFELATDVSQQNADRLADFCDQFLNYVDKNIHHLKSNFFLHIFVYKDRSSFHAILNKSEMVPDQAGLINTERNAVFTSADRPPGVLAELLMHRVLEDVPFVDEWARQGIPLLFEQLYGYSDNGALTLIYGIENPRCLKPIENKLRSVTLTEAIAPSAVDLTQPEASLAGVFLYKSGRLREYLNLCDAGPDAAYATALEALFDKSSTALEPAWQQFIKTIEMNKQQILTIPKSQIFANKQEFDKFAKENRLNF